MIRDDVRVTMPPNPWLYEGRAAILELMQEAIGRPPGDWLLVPTRANRMPAAASYLRARGDTLYRASSSTCCASGRPDRRDHDVRRAPVRELGLPLTRTGR